MANRLEQVLTFTNVAAGGTAVLPHALNVNGRAVIPDFAAVNNGNFDVLVPGTDAAQVTVRNDGLAIGTVNVRIWYDHTILRVYGSDLTTQLTPAPFVIRGAGGGGGGSGSTQQVFRYTIVQPADGSDFMVALPVAMPNDLYSVFPALSGVTSIVGIDCPDILAGDRTTTAFRVETTGELSDGDFIDFMVVER